MSEGEGEAHGLRSCERLHLVQRKMVRPDEKLTSFFKIMIDPDYWNVLYLPPKFVRTRPEVLKKKTYLQDLNGNQWNVTASKENGKWAFKQGWADFSQAHNLQIGDFAVFHYFAGQYFHVQIFNRSGCEVEDFHVDNHIPRKRARHNTDSMHKDGPTLPADEDSANKQDSPDSVVSAYDAGNVGSHDNTIDALPLAVIFPIEERKEPNSELINFADTELDFLMVGRDTPNENREDRTVIDLSNYEMSGVANVSKCNRVHTGNEGSLPCAGTLAKCKNEPTAALKDDIKCNVESLEATKPIMKLATVSGEAWNFDVPKFSKGLGKLPFVIPMAGFKSNDGNGSSPHAGTLVNCKREAGSSDAAARKQEVEYGVKYLEPPNLKDDRKTSYSDVHKISDASIKGEEAVTCDTPFPSEMVMNGFKKEVKAEQLELLKWVSLPSSASDLHCPIQNVSHLCLDLPACLPLFTTDPRGVRSKLVQFRDPAEKIWPVMYHYEPGINILTTGWGEFCKANHIKSGDECIFKVDTEAVATYDVSIVRKHDKPT